MPDTDTDTEAKADDHYSNVSDVVADRLESGDVVDYAYIDEDDELVQGTGVVAKSNAGGVRIYRPDALHRDAILVIKTTGLCKVNNRTGNAGRTRRVGTAGSIRRTGDRVDISYKQGTGYVADVSDL